MISQKCPKCLSSRVRRGYRPTPFWLKILFRYNLLCDNCNWEFTGFAVPGTVTAKPTRNPKKKPVAKSDEESDQNSVALTPHLREKSAESPIKVTVSQIEEVDTIEEKPVEEISIVKDPAVEEIDVRAESAIEEIGAVEESAAAETSAVEKSADATISKKVSKKKKKKAKGKSGV